MAVRTKVLAIHGTTTVETAVTIYTCPADETAIVKSVSVVGPTGTPTGVVRLQVSRAGATPVIFADFAPAVANAYVYLDRWVVLHPGDILQFTATSAQAWRCWISGTELEGVAD